MSQKSSRIVTLIAGAVLGTGIASAQFPSALIGFNGPTLDSTSATELFNTPQLSGTTDQYIIPNSAGQFDHNYCYRVSANATEGAGSLLIAFEWAQTSNADSWLRLTTASAPIWPNPGMHLGGKVRFKLLNFDPFLQAEIGVCIGVRETGVLVPQLGNAGGTGPIEWAGVSTANSVILPGPNATLNSTASGDDLVRTSADGIVTGSVIVAGPNGVLDSTVSGDDVIAAGFTYDADGLRVPIPAISLPPSSFPYEVEWDLGAGTVKYRELVPGPPPFTVVPTTVAAFTGDGVLNAPDSRGSFEHLAIVGTGNGASFVELYMDEVQVESPIPDPTPAPRIVAPVVSTASSVQIQCVDAATSATLYIDGSPAGSAAPVAGIATISPLTLGVGDVLTAKQTANGLESVFSTPVIVYAPGTALADDFDLYGSQEDLEIFWGQAEPLNARRVNLASGSAASCQNFVIEDIPAGGTASRLYYDLGDINGSDASPLVVTYKFRHDLNSTNARCRFELTSSLSRAFGAVGFAFTNDAALPTAYREQYTTITNSPDPVINGYVTDYFLYDYALTGMTRVPGVWHEMKIEVRSSVVNFYIDNVLANPIDPNTLEPLWPGGVPRVNTDPFRYVIIGVGFSSNGVKYAYDDVAVTFDGTPSPFGPANTVTAPTVLEPLLPGMTTVELDDVVPAASRVIVYRDGAALTTVPSPGGPSVSVPVPTLGDAQSITAIQTVGGIDSCLTAPVVVAVPPPSLSPVAAPGQVTAEVRDVLVGFATAVNVYRDLGESGLVLIGTRATPPTATVDVLVTPLVLGDAIVATQVIGGVESPPSAPVIVRDPGIVGPWTATSSLPRGTTDHRLVYVNGFVYCIGGRTGETINTRRAVVYVYYAPVNSDGSLGAWQTGPNLPRPIAAHGAAAVNGRIYVWGGWTDDSVFTTLNYCYYATPNPDTGAITGWTESAVRIPDDPPGTFQMDAFGNGTLDFNGRLYIINGERFTPPNIFSNTPKCFYSTITAGGDFGPWTETTATNDTGSWFHGSTFVSGTSADYVYRVAANYRGTFEVDTFRAQVNSNGSLGSWVEMDANLPEGRYETAVTVVDNKWIFAVDGLAGAEPRNTVYYSAVNPDDGTISEWVSGLPYPLSICRNSALSYKVGGRHYILVVSGGPYASTGTRDPRCYYAPIGVYYDTRRFADFQTCYNPLVTPSADCASAADLNFDRQTDQDDLPELEEYFLGPDQ